MEIENVTLDSTHEHAPVIYVPPHAKGDCNHPDVEPGVIKSWNNKFIFVNFGYNVCACQPKDLKWR